MYMYNIHIALWYKMPNKCELLLYNYCFFTLLVLKLITPYVSFLIVALMYLYIYFVLKKRSCNIYNNFHGIYYICVIVCNMYTVLCTICKLRVVYTLLMMVISTDILYIFICLFRFA